MHETTYCDGSQALIFQQLFCDIPVKSVLRQDPFELGQGQRVTAVVQAYNERGWGVVSEDNTEGVTI